MKNILLGIIAINLIFISANLALRSVGAVHAQSVDLNEINANMTGDITLDGGEDSDEGEDSGEDLNEIEADTTGVITATVSDDGEDSDEDLE